MEGEVVGEELDRELTETLLQLCLTSRPLPDDVVVLGVGQIEGNGEVPEVVVEDVGGNIGVKLLDPGEIEIRSEDLGGIVYEIEYPGDAGPGGKLVEMTSALLVVLDSAEGMLRLVGREATLATLQQIKRRPYFAHKQS